MLLSVKRKGCSHTSRDVIGCLKKSPWTTCMSAKHKSLKVWKLTTAKSAIHTFICGFEIPTLQSGVFHMVLSSLSYKFDISYYHLFYIYIFFIIIIFFLGGGWGFKKTSRFPLKNGEITSLHRSHPHYCRSTEQKWCHWLPSSL